MKRCIDASSWFLFLSITVVLGGLLLPVKTNPTQAAGPVERPAMPGLPGEAQAKPEQQGLSADGIWQDLFQLTAESEGTREIFPEKYRLLAADITALDARLAQAPPEGRDGSTVLTLPLPDGGFGRFRIVSYQMMEPELAAKYPDIKNYIGAGLDDPSARAWLDRTPQGFHGFILSNSDTVYIDPYARGDVTLYMSYYRRDAGNFWEKSFEEPPLPEPTVKLPERDEDLAAATTGPLRREYRLAVAATGEYTTFHGGAAPALAAINTTVNRVNGVYERDLSVRFILVGNNNAVIFTDPNTDPYTDGDSFTMLGQNQTTLDNLIGNGNYDIGHVFGTQGGGGVAYLNGLCTNGSKGAGVSSANPPTGERFDVELVAHEMGHQLGAPHTFNAGTAGNCTEPGNRSGITAYEPASGTTIMSYGGICAPQNLVEPGQPKDRFFHAISLQNMNEHIANIDGICGAKINTNNAAPVVEAGPSYTIPKQTPFTLTGLGSDPNNDGLSYTWEQFDRAVVPWTDANRLPNSDDIGQPVPIFRYYSPISEPVRTFPALPSILNGAYQNIGESLPTINRTLNFRLTARDGKGGVHQDNTTVTVAAGAGPFRVTDPSGGLALWPDNSTQTITWDVANTNQAPVSCGQVNIRLSVDGGQTFPAVIAANTPNDGSETVTLPSDRSLNARIKVECAGNIFFDIAQTGLATCTPVFNDDHEGANNWTTGQSLGSNPWTRVTNDAAKALTGSGYWFAPNIGSPSVSFLESPTITANGADPHLGFFHNYNLEQRNETNGYDGGILEINVNNGGWVYVDSSRFTQNGYNRTLENSTPEIGDKQGFSGNSGGYLGSVVDLSGLVADGQDFKIRFTQANDSSDNVEGWYIDDVVVCDIPPAPSLSITKKVSLSSTPAVSGTLVTYSIVVANNGNAVAQDVRITDTLPAGLQGDSLDQLVTVQPQTGLTLTLNATVVTDSGRIVNTAYFSHPSRNGLGEVSFSVFGANNIYLPAVLKE